MRIIFYMQTMKCNSYISEIDWNRIETMNQADIKEGDMIEVKLLEVDQKTGKFKLSRKALMPRLPSE